MTEMRENCQVQRGKKADYTKYRTVISRAKAYYEIMGAFADNCRQLSASNKKNNERVE